MKNSKIRVFSNICFILLVFACVIPMWLVVSISLTAESEIVHNGYRFFPKAFDLSAYAYILSNPAQLIDSYIITIAQTVLGTLLSVTVMVMVAYALSRENYVFRRQITFYLFFTMLFSGGLVPTYILITQYLKMGDSIWVYIIPHVVNPWHVVLLRTFFQKHPISLIDSAKIDGAGELRILAQIVVPISKPVIATVALFTVLAKWNDWMTSLLYINNDSLITIQYLLQRMMMNINLIVENMTNLPPNVSVVDIPSESTRMAMAVLAAGPMLFVFPFFQKYFTKGLTVGAVKG